MNTSNLRLLLCIALTAILVGCGTLNRFGKDLYVVAASPVLIPYHAATDGYESATWVRDEVGGGTATQVVLMPYTFVGHLYKHLFYTVVHGVDAFFVPVHGLAELNPDGPEIKPLPYYDDTPFDRSMGSQQVASK